MRALSARQIASSALCATLLLGVTAPAALAAGTERDRSAATAPPVGSDAVTEKAQSLGDAGAVVTEVAKLVDAAMKAENGRLSAAEADRLGRAARAAIEKAAASARTSSTPVSPTSGAGATRGEAQAPVDLGPLLDALLGGVTSVLQAATGAGGNVVTEATNLLNDLVAYVASLASDLGGTLPGVPPAQS